MGNHEYQVLKRHHTNLSKRLADALGVPYMGFSYFFRINLFRVDDEIKGQGRNIDFFVQHGFGGGTRTEGGSITKYAKHSERFICDVYVAGHDHRLQFVKFPTMGIRGAKGSVRLFAKSKVVILGGSWKKAYAPGTAVSWEETKGFMPAEIGGVTIRIRVTNDWVDIKVDM
jgi:hypothetical protein